MDTKLTEHGIKPVVINIASENGHHQDLKKDKHERLVLLENIKSPKKKKKDKDDEEDKHKPPPVPMLALFRYSTSKERCMMVIGVLCAMLSGVCLPAMFILFGDVTNAFVYHEMINNLNNESIWALKHSNPNIPCLDGIDNSTTIDTVKECLIKFFHIGNFFDEVVRFGAGNIVIGGIQMLLSYSFVTTMNYAAEGQVFRLRRIFLWSILRQEIAWFDTQQTNDFASRATGDLNKLQEGIGEKVGMFLFFMTTFLHPSLMLLSMDGSSPSLSCRSSSTRTIHCTYCKGAAISKARPVDTGHLYPQAQVGKAADNGIASACFTLLLVLWCPYLF